MESAFGKYTLHDRVGLGGMAEVFLASWFDNLGMERYCVIKRILSHYSEDEQFVRMFVEEAQLSALLKHDNIVRVHDYGSANGRYFIAMEYVEGTDLYEALARCIDRGTIIPGDITLHIVMMVLRGLHYAHELVTTDGRALSIIHRDISPSNVLLSFDGEVKLADFGIAKATTRQRTATGILKGKYGYMAPEQVRGMPLDRRADVFAVGNLLYELLTGLRLFDAPTDFEVLQKVREATITTPLRQAQPAVPVELEQIVLRALNVEPDDRYQTAAELGEALRSFAETTGATTSHVDVTFFLKDLFPEERRVWDTDEYTDVVQLPARRRRSSVQGNIPGAGEKGFEELLQEIEDLVLKEKQEEGSPLDTSPFDPPRPEPRTQVDPRGPLGGAIPEDPYGIIAKTTEPEEYEGEDDEDDEEMTESFFPP